MLVPAYTHRSFVPQPGNLPICFRNLLVYDFGAPTEFCNYHLPTYQGLGSARILACSKEGGVFPIQKSHFCLLHSSMAWRFWIDGTNGCILIRLFPSRNEAARVAKVIKSQMDRGPEIYQYIKLGNLWTPTFHSPDSGRIELPSWNLDGYCLGVSPAQASWYYSFCSPINVR